MPDRTTLKNLATPELAQSCAGWLLQYLIFPAFHPMSCLNLRQHPGTTKIEVWFTIWNQPSLPFYLSWFNLAATNLPEPEAVWESPPTLTSFWEDIEKLAADQATIFSNYLTQLTADSLINPRPTNARDGISIRGWFHRDNLKQSFLLNNPRLEDTPNHATLLSHSLNLARISFSAPPAQLYLTDLARYLPF